MTIDKYRPELDKIRNEAQQVGLYCGYETLHSFYQFKQGYPLIIYGLPYSGKSFVWFSMAINLSKLHGKKHYIYSPEMGSGAEVVETLISMYVGKDVKLQRDKNTLNPYAMEYAEFEIGYNFIRQHFYIAETTDFGEEVTMQNIYDNVAQVEQDGEFTFDTITIDPFAEIKLDIQGGRLDLAISQELGKMREHDRKSHKTTVIINHVINIPPIYDKVKAQSYTPMPLPTQIAGGQMWFRRGYTIICVYRPNPLIFEGSEDNESWIMIQKSKPRGCGKTGQISLFFDNSKHNFYEKTDSRFEPVPDWLTD